MGQRAWALEAPRAVCILICHRAGQDLSKLFWPRALSSVIWGRCKGPYRKTGPFCTFTSVRRLKLLTLCPSVLPPATFSFSINGYSSVAQARNFEVILLSQPMANPSANSIGFPKYLQNLTTSPHLHCHLPTLNCHPFSPWSLQSSVVPSFHFPPEL